MMRSLFSGVAGLRNHQTRMDSVGNNIANVNTTGFKAGRVNFQDMLSQTLQGAASPQGTLGGTNPMQVGLGMSIASMDNQFTNGALQSTGVPTDLAISGDGFFVVSNGATNSYTRDGSFKFDTNGYYVVPGTGLKVQGWMADSLGVINSAGVLTDIVRPTGTTMPASQSTATTFAGNLNASTANGGLAATSVNLYDSLGTKHLMTQNYYKVNVGTAGTGANTWICKTDVAGIGSGSLTNQYTQLNFNTDGTLNTIQTLTPAATVPSTAQQMDITGLQLNSTNPSTNVFTMNVLDSTGATHPVTATFTNLTATTWSLQLSDASGNLGAASTITWGAGQYTGFPANFTYTGTGAVTNTVTLNTPTGSVAPAAAANAGTLSSTNPALQQNVTLNNLKLSTSSDPQIIAFSEFDSTGALRTFKGTFTYNASSSSWSCAITESGDVTNATLLTIPGITWTGGAYMVGYNAGPPVVPGLPFPGATNSFAYKANDAAGTTNRVTINALAGTSVAPDATVMAGRASEPSGATLQATELTLGFSIPGANAMTITSNRSKLTQSSDTTSTVTVTQDGYGMGTLTDTTFDSSGVLTGKFSNGQSKKIAQVAMAKFANNNGLMKAGNNTYTESNNSGVPQIGEANSGGRGSLTPSALEMSNVDLSQEFSNMIITQRGFQANSKIITTSDTMLEELVNLKR